ncbi:MarR family winged helix-turn-helix transcriptional regulator [Archangium minus]|uniref:MarR family winged helix-turn-helix transcriptional regulator n=1 Tax=Archangium minus TaxID=83450 RepID=UPI0037BEB402
MTRHNPPFDHALRVLRLIPRLNRWAVASVQANRLGGELSLRQLTVLYAIREGISSPRHLARRLRVTPAVITGLLDRLERHGYVRREADPDDRRRLRMVLTEAGLTVGQQVQQALANDLATQFASASPTELKALDRALDLVERALVALENRTSTSLDCGAEEDGVEDDEETWAPPADERSPAEPRARSVRTARRKTPTKSGQK